MKGYQLFLIILVSLCRVALSHRSPADSLQMLTSGLWAMVPAVVTIGGGLVLIISLNLKKSLDAMVVVLKQVTKGRFGSQVKVTTNDEIGYVGDVEDSGQFMTLFFLTVDPANQNLQWVRAGHDPGISYDPATDTFEDLKGKGIALGVDENWQYEMNERIGLVNGQIIVLSTDGVWEAHNHTGEIFGKARLYEIIRQNSIKKAKEIIEAVVVALGQFQKDSAIEDDVMLVVIKIEEDLGHTI